MHCRSRPHVPLDLNSRIVILEGIRRVHNGKIESADDLKPLSVPRTTDMLAVISCKLTSGTTLFSSICAIFFPRHRHRPLLKAASTTAVLSCSVCSSGSSRNLSGRNVRASCPNVFLSASIPTMENPMAVPPGMNRPLYVSPSGGTSLGITPVIGGQMRMPSLMMAWR